MRVHFLCFFLIASLGLVWGQTLTTIDPDSGNTVIEVITVDPVEGLPTTEILQTVIATTTQAQVTVPTTDAGQVGPIGQPQSTLPGQSETPFTYTTTNAEGLTVAVVATFTPSFPATVPRTGLATGTILSYSQWLSMVGTNTVAADSSSAGAKRWSVSGKWVGIIAGLVVGAAGGAGLVLA